MSATAQAFDILLRSPLAGEWIRELGWKREEVTDVSVKCDPQPNGYETDEHGQRWALWKPGPVTVTLHRGDEVESRMFDNLKG